MPQQRVYMASDEILDEDILTSDTQSSAPAEVESNMAQLVAMGKQTLKRRKPSYHWTTKNKSFLALYNDYYKMGIKNCKFFLKIYDTDLTTIDPYSPVLPVELQLKIILECIINPWYWLREVCRVPVDGMPIAVGSGSSFNIDRASAASWYLFLNNIDHYLVKPRQRGKTIDCIAKCLYAYMFGALGTNMLFFNKDAEYAIKNLTRLKDMRDMLPAWMQMRSIIIDDGKVDRGTENIKTIRNPVTSNSISVQPKATSKESAQKLGRGATAAIQYYDEFDFMPYNKEIMNAAAFAYSTASQNAKANYSASCRLISSTPGDLDTRDGITALEVIDKCIKWTDNMLDKPINQLTALVRSPGHNGIVYIEYRWQQLRLPMKWYEDQCVLVGFDPEQIAREIELQRIQGNALSPFRRADLMYITQHKKEPLQQLDILNNMQTINVYEKLYRSYPYVIAIDPADGLSGDNYAISIINPRTYAVAAEFRSKYLSQTDMVKMITVFADQYCPKALFVVEANKGFETINQLLESKFRYQIFYDEQRMLRAREERSNEYGELQRASMEKKAYGFNTTPSSRPKLFAILENFMEERRDILYTDYIVDDITGLIRKTNGRIEAGQGKHDDNIMSYLIGLAVLLHSTPDHLSQWGISPGMREPMTEEEAEQMKRDPRYVRGQIRDILPTLPDSMKDLFKDILDQTDPVEEANRYQEELARIQTAQTPFTQPDGSGMPKSIGVTADPSDVAYWNEYDRQVVDSNFEQDYDVDINAFLGEGN